MNVLLSKTELRLIANALNEILNGIDIEEFETRLGVSREDAKALHDRVNRLYDEEAETG